MLMGLRQTGAYGAALNTITCAPLDVQCICGSRTFLEAAQSGIPQACPVADQKPVFNYIEEACNDFSLAVTLSPTSVPLTASTAQTVTLTTKPTSSSERHSTVECTKPALSTGASARIIVAAFFIGAIVTTGVAMGCKARRRPGKDPIHSSDIPYVGWHAAPMLTSYSK